MRGHPVKREHFLSVLSVTCPTRINYIPPLYSWINLTNICYYYKHRIMKIARSQIINGIKWQYEFVLWPKKYSIWWFGDTLSYIIITIVSIWWWPNDASMHHPEFTGWCLKASSGSKGTLSPGYVECPLKRGFTVSSINYFVLITVYLRILVDLMYKSNSILS